MKKELADKLKNDFPVLCQDYGGDPTKTCMAFGFAVGDGWEPILRELFDKLEVERLRFCAEGSKTVKLLQVKEKFGALRVYVEGWSARIKDAIFKAQEESLGTCEDCGTKEDVSTEGSWLKTLCDKCRDAYKSKRK